MKKRCFVALFLAITLLFTGCIQKENTNPQGIPPFSGTPYCVINENVPNFTAEDITNQAYERYALLDWYGRCGVAVACLGKELMPTEDRESIGHIKPSGWVQAQYDFVEGKNLYNRCHLIGFQLSAENDNEKNLITGTRYMNVEGMLPFENMVADYIKETGNHVLYRVTPVFEESNLLAKGVRMEAMSVEDNGEGILFHIFAYNLQPGVVIDYKTGESFAEESDETKTSKDEVKVFILNTKSKKFHLPDCNQVKTIKKENYEERYISRDKLLDLLYVPAGCCNP